MDVARGFRTVTSWLQAAGLNGGLHKFGTAVATAAAQIPLAARPFTPPDHTPRRLRHARLCDLGLRCCVYISAWAVRDTFCPSSLMRRLGTPANPPRYVFKSLKGTFQN